MNTISIPYKDELIYIPLDKITHCEAEKSYTWIHLNNGKKLLSSKNLGAFEKVLPKFGEKAQDVFFRIHHGNIVNGSYIEKFSFKESKITLSNGMQLKISQRKKSKFRKAISILFETI